MKILIDYITTVLAAHTTVASNPEICELSRQLAIWQTLASEESAAEAASAVEVKDHKRELFLVLIQAALHCKDRLANTVAHKILGECFTHPEILSYQATGTSGPEKSLLATFYPNYHPTKEFAEKHLTTTSGDATPIPGASLPKLLKTLHSPAQHIIFSNLDTNTLFRLKESHPEMEALLIKALFTRQGLKSRQFQTHFIKTLLTNETEWRQFQERHLNTTYQKNNFTALLQSSMPRYYSPGRALDLFPIQSLLRKVRGETTLPKQQAFQKKIANAEKCKPRSKDTLFLHSKTVEKLLNHLGVIQSHACNFSRQTQRKAVSMLLKKSTYLNPLVFNTAIRQVYEVTSYLNKVPNRVIQFLAEQSASTDTDKSSIAINAIRELLVKLSSAQIGALLEHAKDFSSLTCKDDKPYRNSLQIISIIMPWLSPQETHSLSSWLSEKLSTDEHIFSNVNIMRCLEALNEHLPRSLAKTTNHLTHYLLNSCENSFHMLAYEGHIERLQNRHTTLSTTLKKSTYTLWLKTISTLNQIKYISLGLKIIPNQTITHITNQLETGGFRNIISACLFLQQPTLLLLPQSLLDALAKQTHGLIPEDSPTSWNRMTARSTLLQLFILRPQTYPEASIAGLHTITLTVLNEQPVEDEERFYLEENRIHRQKLAALTLTQTLTPFLTPLQIRDSIESLNSLFIGGGFNNDYGSLVLEIAQTLGTLHQQAGYLPSKTFHRLFDTRYINEGTPTLFTAVCNTLLSREQQDFALTQLTHILFSETDDRTKSLAVQMLPPLAKKTSPALIEKLERSIEQIIRALAQLSADYERRENKHTAKHIMRISNKSGETLLRLYVKTGFFNMQSLRKTLTSLTQSSFTQKEIIIKYLYFLTPTFTRLHCDEIAKCKLQHPSFFTFKRATEIARANILESDDTPQRRPQCSTM